MCGLAGIAKVGGGSLNELSSRPILDAMTRCLSLRGPDDTKVALDGAVGLGFTRLSIVDPVGGGQPLRSDDGAVVLIANGEIYNHRELAANLRPRPTLRTDSDCEVLVHLYREKGVRFLDDVRGIYAIVIWDRRRNKLVFARDRFGVKPLFFARTPEGITFASEIKAMFADPSVPRTVDWTNALRDQMLTTSPFLDGSEPLSWFEGIQLAPAAAVVEIDLGDGRMNTHHYWQLPLYAHDGDVAPDELVDEYRALLQESVEESGMSDAEIGLFLSGGIDSAAVAAFSSGLEDLHTFTVLNGGTAANGDAASARETARVLGRANHQVVFGPDRIPTPDEWKRLVWLLETPQCGPEQFYKFELHRAAKRLRPDIKVMLLGQGSDEFNGGYSVELGGDSWDGFTRILGDLEKNRGIVEDGRLARWWESELPLLESNVFDSGSNARLDPYDAYIRSRYRQIQQYICWHEDRTAAGNGIEARVPFLDHRLVELTARIPRSQRAELLWDKQILRLALKDVLPDHLRAQRKLLFFHGSGVNHVYRVFVRMLAQDSYALLEEAFSGGSARDYVDVDNARELLTRFPLVSRDGNFERLLALVNLGLLDQMVRDAPRALIDWESQPISIQEATNVEPEAFAINAFTDTQLVNGELVPEFGQNVALLHEPRSDAWFFAIDGRLEFEIDESESPSLLPFFQSVGDGRSVAEILTALDVDRTSFMPSVADAVAEGVITLSPRTREKSFVGRALDNGSGRSELADRSSISLQSTSSEGGDHE